VPLLLGDGLQPLQQLLGCVGVLGRPLLAQDGGVAARLHTPARHLLAQALPGHLIQQLHALGPALAGGQADELAHGIRRPAAGGRA
jgi:hypothetical protein